MEVEVRRGLPGEGVSGRVKSDPGEVAAQAKALGQKGAFRNGVIYPRSR